MNRFSLSAISKQSLIVTTFLIASCQLTTPTQQQPTSIAKKSSSVMMTASVIPTKVNVAAVQPVQKSLSVEAKPLKADQLANKIKNLIASGYLTKPASNNALVFIRKLEEKHPKHSSLIPLKQMLASKLMQVAKSAYSKKNQAKALYYANVAQQVVPDIAGGADLVKQIRQQVKEQSAAAAVQKNIKTLNRVTVIQPPAKDGDSLIAKTLFESLSDEQRKVLAELPQDVNSVLINIIILNQNEIQDRLFDVRYVLDSIVDQMVKENARVVVTTRTMRDSRWLAALLKTRIREVNPYFELNLLKRVNTELKPHIALYAQ